MMIKMIMVSGICNALVRTHMETTQWEVSYQYLKQGPT